MSELRTLIMGMAKLLETDSPVALVTITQVQGSAPCGLGTTMAVTPEGVFGSLPAGCVEGAVLDTAYEVLASGRPDLSRYGCDQDAPSPFAPAMTCGGMIQVLVHRTSATDRAALRLLRDAVADDADVVFGTLTRDPCGPGAIATVTADRSSGNETVRAAARPMLADRSRPLNAAEHTNRSGVLLESLRPRPRLLLFGANDVAAALSRQAQVMGYRVTVCDARPAFATPERFPAADEIVTCWPPRLLDAASLTEQDAICILTHDPKFDLPLLQHGLGSSAGYVGAIGSRRTHANRVAALRADGITADQLARLRSPIGLDLGATTAAETAISILAEILQSRQPSSARPLSRTAGPIHTRSAAVPALW